MPWAGGDAAGAYARAAGHAYARRHKRLKAEEQRSIEEVGWLQDEFKYSQEYFDSMELSAGNALQNVRGHAAALRGAGEVPPNTTEFIQELEGCSGVSTREWSVERAAAHMHGLCVLLERRMEYFKGMAGQARATFT